MIETKVAAQSILAKSVARPYQLVTILWVLCLLLFLVFLLVPRSSKNLFSSDGIEYFATLRSLVIDHDLNLDDEFHYLDKIPDSGSTALVHPIGMAIVWLPFYLAAHLVSSVAGSLGLPIAANGYNHIYQFAVCAGSMFYGLIGLLLILRLCLEFFENTIAIGATICIWFGWILVYYLVVENSMSHMASLSVVTAFIVWWRLGSKSNIFSYWAGLGALLGLAAMIRSQDAAFVILPVSDLAVFSFVLWRRHYLTDFKRVLGYSILLICGFVIAYTPQLAASYKIYGNALANGNVQAGGTFNWTSPELFNILFSTLHGLFTWHLLIVLAVVGLLLLAKKDLSYTIKLGLALILQIYIAASWWNWWQGDAFGERVFISSAPIFALGLAALFHFLLKNLGWWSVWSIAGTAFIWNFLFMAQYRLGLIPSSDYLTWKQLTIDKIGMVVDIIQHGVKYTPGKH